MRKLIFALAALISVGMALVPGAVRSQAPGQGGKGLPFDLGPSEKGATLRIPGFESGPPSAGPTAGQSSFVQSILNPGAATSGTGAATSGTATPGTAMTTNHSSLLPYDSTGINNDILVNEKMGPWMIHIISYAGPEGPMRARNMVRVLRGEQFKLPAYVFNYGAAEKRKEYERVKALVEKQKEALAANNLPIDQPIRVKHLRIDEHCGVLVGAYPTQEAAQKIRDHLRKQPFPDPTTVNVELEVQFYERQEDPNDPKVPKAERAWVNPFTRAMVVHNPATKVERKAEWDKLDIAGLKRMNAEEDFSLLACKKKYTLVIKQFNLPAVTAHRNDSEAPSFWNPFGLGKKPAHQIDGPAEDAHNFTEALRKSKLEAYVLHAKYYSLVTVGGFDSLDDANMRSMQNILETGLFKAPTMERVGLFAKAMPMEIPH